MNFIYNAYISSQPPYETIPEDQPPGSERPVSPPSGKNSLSALGGLWDKFKHIDSGDLLLLLIVFLLLKEGDQSDLFLLLILAAVFLLDGGDT